MIQENNEKVFASIQELLKLSSENLEKNSFSKHPKVIEIYFKSIIEEVVETKEELKKNNSIYLEDELGDIFWDYLMILKLLERDGYIRSWKNIFHHSLEKYTQRYTAMFGVDEGMTDSVKREEIWSKIKKEQKEILKKRHKKLYGK